MHKKGIDSSLQIQKFKKRLEKAIERKGRQKNANKGKDKYKGDATPFRTVGFKRVDENQKGKLKYLIDEKEYFAEEAAIKYYESMGYKALWTENNYWWMLMSLFFWDIIFAPIKGAVRASVDGVNVEIDPEDTKFQVLYRHAVEINGMPSDFFYPEFYTRREQLIMNKIKTLLNSNLTDVLRQSYEENYGKTCRPIEDWNKYKLEELFISIQKVDKDSLLKILARLISNFNQNRAGLPDLIVYNESEFFFSEVKSENDKLSERQRKWHHFLTNEVGIKVEVFLINQSGL